MNEYYQDNYNDRQEQSTSPVAGIMLIALAMLLVGVMVFAIYSSWNSPPPPFTPSFTNPSSLEASGNTSPTPNFELIDVSSDTPKPSDTDKPKKSPKPSKKPTPKPSKKPVVKPSKKPEPTPTKTEEPDTPTPEPTTGEKIFRPAPFDGPPEEAQKGSDTFLKNLSQKATLYFRTDKMKGTTVYLINVQIKTYYVLKFDKVEGEKGLYKTEIPAGLFRLRIIKGGYFPLITGELPLRATDEVEINDVRQKRPWLKIKSSPSDAKIYLDDLYAGQTPKTVIRLDAKEYKVKLVKEGYKTKEFKLKFEEGKGITKNIKLTK